MYVTRPPSDGQQGLELRARRGTDANQGIAVISRHPARRLEPLAIPNLHPTILPVLVHGAVPFLFVGVWTHKMPTYAAVALAGVAACCAGAEGLPVVTTPEGNESIGARHGEEQA